MLEDDRSFLFGRYCGKCSDLWTVKLPGSRSEKAMKRVFLGVDGSLTRVHHLDRWEASGSVEGTHPSSLTQPTCNSWEVRIWVSDIPGMVVSSHQQVIWNPRTIGVYEFIHFFLLYGITGSVFKDILEAVGISLLATGANELMLHTGRKALIGCSPLNIQKIPWLCCVFMSPFAGGMIIPQRIGLNIDFLLIGSMYGIFTYIYHKHQPFM